MKALTVQQPWAWAIAYGGKNPELRSRATSYRGPLAIHAGARWSTRGATDARVLDAWTTWLRMDRPIRRELLERRAVIAVAELVDCHPAAHCCPPWGDDTYDGKSVHHLTLADVRPLAEPARCQGALGLWTVPDDIAAAISAALPAGETTP